MVVVILLVVIALALVSYVAIKSRSIAGKKYNYQPTAAGWTEKRVPPAAAQHIQPLNDFRWDQTDPQKLRPFKPIYHITMALQATPPSDLITIDCNYMIRIGRRRQVIAQHPETVMGAFPVGVPAVNEVYSYLMTDYLPTRYPTIFSTSADKTAVENTVTGKVFPANPPSDPLDAWRILGETVEEDFFLLHEMEKGHQLVAFLCCHPSGFDPSEKLGKVLKDIHTHVPAYEKIGLSMERFFSRLEVGKSVKRVNWSVTTQDDLFTPKGTHVHEDEAVKEDEDVDMDKARVRIEFQTLTRLPKTRAVMFSFKSYLYPVKDIKAEGLGPELADAIEGLTKGNAPGMWTYKGAIRWGKSVCEYLRS